MKELSGALVTLAYDPSYQLILEQRSGATPFFSTYTYDAVGNRLSYSRNGALTTYQYDRCNQLTIERLGGSQILYGYDLNGNRLQKNDNGYLQNYAWDGENRMTGIAYPDGSRDTYVYSGDGDWQKKLYTGGSTIFVHDGANILQRADQSGASYVTGAQYTDYPGEWGGLASAHQPDGSYYFATDRESNTRLVMNAAGLVDSRYDYDGFGIEVATVEGIFNPFRFGGEVGYFQDGDSRYVVRARQYDARIGRWLSRDPIGFAGGDFNLYRYVYNNPANLRDPLGLATDPSPGNTDSIRLVLNAFIPTQYANAPGFNNPLFGTALGDNRGFSSNSNAYRAMNYAVINLKKCMCRGNWDIGTSHNTNGDSMKQPDSSSMIARVSGDCKKGWDIYFAGNPKYPMIPFNQTPYIGPLFHKMSPGVTYKVSVHVTPDGKLFGSITHDPYPSYELWLYTGVGTARMLYGYMVPDSAPNLSQTTAGLAAVL